MDCPISTGTGPEVFVSYSAGLLAPARATELETHLSSCPDCRQMADAQIKVWGSLDLWEPEPVSPDFNRRLYARIAEVEKQPWHRRMLCFEWPLRHRLSAAAACLVLLAALLFRIPAHEHQPDQVLSEKKIDIEQVERTLDDIEMLQQLGIVVQETTATPHTEAM